MRHLNILLLNWRCWLNPQMGGAEVFTREICKRLVKFGHSVTLFTSMYPEARAEETVDSVQIVRAGGKYSVYSEARKAYVNRFCKENFDVVIDEINTKPFFAPKFVCNGERVVALIHQLAREYWFYEVPFGVSHLGYHFLENRWLRPYVNVPTITVSNSTKTDLTALGFKEIYVVSEGLNFKPLEEIPTKTSFPVVVYAGRLKRAKRPDNAIESFKLLKDSYPNAELWVIGDGDFREKLEGKQVSGVKFFGNLDSPERRALIAKSWVLVNPSVREGWGLNVIEAGALGVPTVAYNVPGLRDAIKDGLTGLLVEDGNVYSLAKALNKLIKDSAYRADISAEALKYSGSFSWDKSAAEIQTVLEQITNEQPTVSFCDSSNFQFRSAP